MLAERDLEFDKKKFKQAHHGSFREMTLENSNFTNTHLIKAKLEDKTHKAHIQILNEKLIKQTIEKE